MVLLPNSLNWLPFLHLLVFDPHFISAIVSHGGLCSVNYSMEPPKKKENKMYVNLCYIVKNLGMLDQDYSCKLLIQWETKLKKNIIF